MNHCGCTHPGPDVGGTGGQITELFIKCEVELAFQHCINAVDQLKSLRQVKSAGNGLHAQVIFLIDHDAQGLCRVDDHCATHALGRMLATDQMSLHQYLFFGSR